MVKPLPIKFLVNVLLLIAAFSFSVREGYSQVVTNYAFATNTNAGNYTALTGATVPTPLVGTIDNGAFYNIPIGFEFWYMGNRYTQLSAGTNGIVSFSNILTADNYQETNNLANSQQRNVLAPLWDNLSLSAATGVSYLTTGAAGARVFTIQFVNMRWQAAGASVISFQVRLTEANGAVELVYSQPNATAPTTPSASIGINGPNTGNGNFLSVNAATTGVTSNAENNITAKPVTNQIFSFIPPSVAAPTALAFSNISQTSMNLSWTGAANATGYAIYKSTDGGATYNFEITLPATQTSYAASGLNPNTNYFWRIFSIRETNSQTPLTGNQSTSFLFAYPFSGNANDVGGTGNNGTPQGTPPLTADRFGNLNNAYQFDGVDDQINTLTSMVGPSVYSISIWFRTTVAGGKLIGFGNSQAGSSGSYDRHIYMGNNGRIYFGAYSGATNEVGSLSALNDGQWHNAIATMSASGMKLYIDGVLQGTNANTVSENFTGYWKIGYDNIGGWPNTPTNARFNGALDDIQITNYEMSAAQISSLSFNTYNTYGYTLPLTLNTTSIIDGAQVNFPYLIQVTDPNLKLVGDCDISVASPVLGKVTSPVGNDIAFTDEFGALLSHEVERYDPVSGTLFAWVKLPSVNSSSNKTIKVIFGKPGATPLNPASTWDSDYKAVFHFKETAYTGTTADATQSLTGTTTGMTAANLVSSKIGNSYSFNGSSQKIEVAANPVYAITGPSSTVSAWIFVNGTAGDQKVVTNQEIESAPADPSDPSGLKKGGYKIGLYNLIPEAENRGATGTTFSNRASYSNVSGQSTTLATGTWYYVQSVYGGNVVTTYVNGVERQKRINAQNASDGRNLLIGVGEGGNIYWFNGLIDEVRVSNIAKTSSWLLSEYRNQNSPTALTVGTIAANLPVATTYPGLVYTFTGTTTYPGTSWTNTIANVTGAPSGNFASVIIPASKAPVLSTSQTVYALYLAASTSTIALQGNTMNVGCNVYNNGQFIYSANSTLNFNGTIATQQYNGLATPVNTFDNLSVNNTFGSAGGTVNINNASRIDVSKLLSVTRGTLNVTASAGLTIKSSATSNANVAPLVSGTSNITGNLSIESFFTGGLLGTATQNYYRGTRLVSTPIDDSGLANKSYKQLQNFMIITGANGGGFDIGNFERPYATTITKFNEAPASQSFPALTNINNAAPAGDGFFLFYRGNRTNYTVSGGFGVGNRIDAGTVTNQIYAVPESQPVTYVGPLNKFDKQKQLSYTANAGDSYNGYNVVGNPYASTISFQQLFSDNSNKIDNFAIIIKPGGIQATNSNGVYTNWGNSGQEGQIQTGQGFYVRAKSTANGQQLIFKETQKLSTVFTPPKFLSAPQLGVDGKRIAENPDGSASAPTNSSAPKAMKLNLANALDKDEIALVFGSGNSAKYEGPDALHGTNPVVELGSLSEDNQNLAINFLPEVKDVSQVKLFINTNESGEVNVNFTDLTPVYDYKVLLKDNYLNKTQKILENPKYTFSIDKSKAETFGNNRLVLLFEKETAIYKLTSFTAAKNGVSNALLKWAVENEKSNAKYAVEKSVDGINFSFVAEMDGKFAGLNGGNYNLNDPGLAPGKNYYRIKQTEASGRVTYSNAMVVDNLSDSFPGGSFKVYPTFADNEIKIVLDSKNQNNPVLVEIYNMLGRRVISGAETSINVSRLPAGMYIVLVKEQSSGSEFGKGKFIKK